MPEARAAGRDSDNHRRHRPCSGVTPNDHQPATAGCSVDDRAARARLHLFGAVECRTRPFGRDAVSAEHGLHPGAGLPQALLDL